MYALNDYGASPPPDFKVPTAMRDTNISGLIASYQVQHRVPGFRRYEIKDHLGNVRTVISDIKNPYTTSGSITNWTYLADVRNISNMYPYGKSYPAAATYSSDDDYSYGFNGMEKEKSFDGEGDVADFGARIFDANYPVFLSIDPLAYELPNQSPYVISANNPVFFIDENGKHPGVSYFYTELDIGIGALGGVNYTGTTGVVYDDIGVTAIQSEGTMNILSDVYEHITEGNINSNPDWTIGFGGSAMMGVSQFYSADIFSDIMDKNTMSIPIAKKYKAGLGLAGSFGIDLSSISLPFGIGAGLKVTSPILEIEQSISLSDKDVSTLKGENTLFDRLWMTSDPIAITNENGDVVGFESYLIELYPGIKEYEMNETTIKLKSGVVNIDGQDPRPDNIWKSEDYLEEEENIN